MYFERDGVGRLAEVEYGDVFFVSLKGAIVFFEVVGKDTQGVYLVELQQTVINEDRIKLKGDTAYSKKPLVVLGCENTSQKTTYHVRPEEYKGEVVLPIKLAYDSPFLKEASKNGYEMESGVYYAIKEERPFNTGFLYTSLPIERTA